MVKSRKVWIPKTLQEAWSIRQQIGAKQSCFVSGGTWLRTQWEAKVIDQAIHLICLDRIQEMKDVLIDRSLSKLTIGSCNTLAKLHDNSILINYAPTLVEACQNIAAPSIRNQGTIGGNIATGIGDAIPALLIAETKLLWFNGLEHQEQLLEEWLIKRELNNKSEERILVGLIIPISSNQFSFFKKIGRRETFTPSIITVACRGNIDENGLFQNVALAVGGGVMQAIRLFEAEREINGQPISEPLLKKLYSLILIEIKTKKDNFFTESYKKQLAANLIISELYNVLQQGGEQYAFGSS